MYRVYYQIWLRDQLTQQEPYVDDMKRFSDFWEAENFVRRHIDAATENGDVIKMTVTGVGSWHDDEDIVELTVY